MGFFPLSFLLLLLNLVHVGQCHLASVTQLSEQGSHVSVMGDPGMKSPNSRFALEAWNFCNEVGIEAPNMGSPRLADCADIIYCPNQTGLLTIITFMCSILD